MKRIGELLLIIGLISLVAGCTTRKRKDDVSLLGKVWHNTTAHYNGYFNAEELLAASMLQLEDQHRDNYNQLLDVYEYVAVDNPAAVADNLDEAIKKVTVVVNLHPQSHWVDDCYLLAGKAQYLKQDYEAAEKTFRYLINEFPPEEAGAAKSAKSSSGKSRGGKSNVRTPSRNERNRTPDNDNSSREERTEQEAPKSAKEQARERKRYNREVKKKRRESAKAKNKRSSGKSRQEKPQASREEPEEKPAEIVTAPNPQAEPAVADTATPVVNTGMIRLSDNDASTASSPMTGADPEGYFLKHRPAYQEGRLWLARALIERDNIDGAQLILTDLENNRGTFDDIRQAAMGVQAYLYLKDQNYERALTYLERAAEESKDRDQRARFLFIKGQLHQRLGQSDAAYAAYESVIDAKPEYEMEFSARLNLAQNAYLSERGTADEAIANLERMLKEEKNAPYQDQIYYALGNIEIERGNAPTGIEYLQQSLASGGGNPGQQVETYYRLGTLYFEQGEFISAQQNLDLAVGAMAKTDERLRPATALRDNLNDIATNIQAIQLQDSLLRISMMSADEQNDLAMRLDQMRREANSANAPVSGDTGGANTPPDGLPNVRNERVTSPALRTETSWFAYDDRAVKRGQKEFERRWGNRPLEDNWRRGNRTDAGGFGTDAPVADAGSRPSLLTEEEVGTILSGVPRTENEREQARLKMKEALFNLGRLYRDRLEDNERAVEMLEMLNERYPNSNFELESWYYLYLAHNDLKNTAKSQSYRDKILEKYAGTNYGRMLSDPNFAQQHLSEEGKLNREYDEVYRLFEQGRYQDVVTRGQQATARLFGKHALKPKYALLTAMATGNLQGKDAYVTELQKVIATYPESPEQVRAREILRLLGAAGNTTAAAVADATETEGTFKVNDSELHYIIIVFRDQNIDLNAAKVTVSDYNETYHKLDKLRISNVYLGAENNVPVLVLRRFKDKAEAMTYFDGARKNGQDFLNPSMGQFDVYAVTQSNYREILKARSVDSYNTFFSSYYLQ